MPKVKRRPMPQIACEVLSFPALKYGEVIKTADIVYTYKMERRDWGWIDVKGSQCIIPEGMLGFYLGEAHGTSFGENFCIVEVEIAPKEYICALAHKAKIEKA